MPDSLTIHLENTSTDEVYAYVTGYEIDNCNGLVMVKSDGRSLYRPANLVSDVWLQPLEADIAIPLGKASKTGTDAKDGCTVQFSRGPKKLTFLINPAYDQTDGSCGAALIEPSILNPADANIGIDYSFCEFTYNKNQLYANISYVDFVPRLPISLTLKGADNPKDTQHVSGMKDTAFADICEALRAQTDKDGYPWSSLVMYEPSSGGDADADTQKPLRVLSPMHGRSVGASFDGYYEEYVNQVWDYYREGGDNNNWECRGDDKSKGGHELLLDSQSAAGMLKGVVDRYTDLFTFYPVGKPICFGGPDDCMLNDPEIEVFYKPSTTDILRCNSGPFLGRNRPIHNVIVPRLAAAFQRSTLLHSAVQPLADATAFYTHDITNHYARIVHEANLDGKGYAFAYDDVQSTNGSDQSGKVNISKPGFFKVAVGGKNTYTGLGSRAHQETRENKTADRPVKEKSLGNVRFPMYSTTTKYRAKGSRSGSGSASGAGSNAGGTPEGSTRGPGSVHSIGNSGNSGNESIKEEDSENSSEPSTGATSPHLNCTLDCTSQQTDCSCTAEVGGLQKADPSSAQTSTPHQGHASASANGADVRDWDNMWDPIVAGPSAADRVLERFADRFTDRLSERIASEPSDIMSSRSHMDIETSHVEYGGSVGETGKAIRFNTAAGEESIQGGSRGHQGCLSVFRCWKR